MNNAIYITLSVGIILSAYTLYIGYKTKKDSSYKAVCDISNKMSCTRTFHSSYGKTLGVPNGWWGLLFYILIIGLSVFGCYNLVLYAAIFGVLYSARLAYILYFKLKNFCLVCNGIYLVNILLLIFAWLGY